MEIEGIGDTEGLDLTSLWLRRLAWDALPCEMVEEVHKELGLVPPGEDQQSDKDHEASHRRIQLVDKLSTSVDYLAPYVSKVLTKAIVLQLNNSGVTPEIEAKLVTQNTEIIRSSTLTIIAQFIATGIMEYTGTK